VVDALTWMVVIAALVTGGTVMAMSMLAIIRRQEVAARFERLFISDGTRRTPLDAGLHLLERFGRWVEGARVNRDLRALVLQAGFFQGSAFYIFVALRYLIGFLVAITVLVLRYDGDGLGPIDVALALVFGFFFYRYALIALKLYVERRASAIRRELPPLLDVMLMALDAGVSIDQCMRYVAGISAGTAPVTGGVLRRHIADLDAGMPYDTALDRFGQRLGIDEGQDLASTIKQALFQGGELGTTLRRFSIDLSEKRMAAVREQVGRKGPHLTLVMILFFMPVLLVVLAGPAVVNLKGALVSAGEQLGNRGGK
jgi:tight adherence protein C